MKGVRAAKAPGKQGRERGAGNWPGGARGEPQRLLFHTLAWWQVAGLSVLLILPARAVLVPLWCYVAVVMDKRKAQTGRWRTPEATLHTLELLGGWPGSFLAQRQFRHKVSKVSYQVVFWVMVGINQVVAFDFVNDWRYSARLLEVLR